MEIVDFSQTGGFPVKQKTFGKLQMAHFEILKAIIGHFGLDNSNSYIISGCEIAGANITPGVLYIKGDLCTFAGGAGTLTTKIDKIVTTEDAAFKNGNNYPVYTSIVADINSDGPPLSNFIRVPNVQAMVNQVVNYTDIENIPAGLVIDPAVGATPVQPLLLDRVAKIERMVAPLLNKGGVLLWNKPANQIPTGWQECVDFQGRMPVGLDTRTFNGQFMNPEFSQVGTEGGNKNGVLDIENLPPHDHEVGYLPLDLAGSNDGYLQSEIVGPTSQTKVKTTKSGGLQNGTIKPFSVLNPYRVVTFIEFIG